MVKTQESCRNKGQCKSKIETNPELQWHTYLAIYLVWEVKMRLAGGGSRDGKTQVVLKNEGSVRRELKGSSAVSRKQERLHPSNQKPSPALQLNQKQSKGSDSHSCGNEIDAVKALTLQCHRDRHDVAKHRQRALQSLCGVRKDTFADVHTFVNRLEVPVEVSASFQKKESLQNFVIHSKTLRVAKRPGCRCCAEKTLALQGHTNWRVEAGASQRCCCAWESGCSIMVEGFSLFSFCCWSAPWRR